MVVIQILEELRVICHPVSLLSPVLSVAHVAVLVEEGPFLAQNVVRVEVYGLRQSLIVGHVLGHVDWQARVPKLRVGLLLLLQLSKRCLLEVLVYSVLLVTLPAEIVALAEMHDLTLVSVVARPQRLGLVILLLVQFIAFASHKDVLRLQGPIQLLVLVHDRTEEIINILVRDIDLRFALLLVFFLDMTIGLCITVPSPMVLINHLVHSLCLSHLHVAKLFEERSV